MEHFSEQKMEDNADLVEMTSSTERVKIRLVSIIWRIIVAAAMIAGATYVAVGWVTDKPEPVKRQARERSFTISVADVVKADYQTDLETFGQIVASKTIDMRAQVAGTVVTLSPNFVAGGEISKGELLFAIDSFSYDGALEDARFALADARLQLKISQEQLNLQQLSLASTRDQLSFAQRDLERAQALFAVGSATDKTLEEREFIVSQRAQALAKVESEIEVQRASLEREKTAISRAEWVETQALRAVENTKIYAPFDGIVQSETIELGRLVSTNEVLAKVYEKGTLEARFTLTDRQYGQLLQAGLTGRSMRAIWNIDQFPLEIDGEITRTGAEINAAIGGVEVYAVLNAQESSNIRPGAFVAIEVDGPIYQNSFRVPETSVYENSHVYAVEEGRLKRKDIKILNRDGAFLIVEGDFEPGIRIMASRLSQAGDGVRVTIEGEEVPTPTRGGSQNAGNNPATSAPANDANAGERPLPPGATRNDDGSISLPNGNTRMPDGRVVDPDGKPVAGRNGRPSGNGRSNTNGGQ